MARFNDKPDASIFVGPADRLARILRVAGCLYALSADHQPRALAITLAELKSFSVSPWLSPEDREILVSLQTEISDLISGSAPH